MDLEKMAEVMEKIMQFLFWSKYIVLFENWNILLIIKQKYDPKWLGFQHFLVMENIN